MRDSNYFDIYGIDHFSDPGARLVVPGNVIVREADRGYDEPGVERGSTRENDDMAEWGFSDRVFGAIAGRHLLSILIVTVALGLGAAAKAATPPHACKPVVEAMLAKRGIDKADIRAIIVEANRAGGRAVFLLGYSFWVQLKSCKGAIVIDLGTECSHQQTYAHGACKLP